MIGKPGPFQIIRDVPSGAQDRDTGAPRRRFSCSNYLVCLDLAAAMNWDNFTCRGCSGEINQNLIWRAHQAMKADKSIRTFCSIPDIQSVNGDASQKNSDPLILTKKLG